VESFRRERERAGGWPENEIAHTVGDQLALFERSSADAYHLEADAMFHVNWTDAPILTPVTGATPGPRGRRDPRSHAPPRRVRLIDAHDARIASAVMSVQYATPDRLKDRLALHERFAPEQEPFHSWLFRQVQAPARADVLEVGCGSGHMWTVVAPAVPRGWRLTLSDPSEGMLAETRANLRRVGLEADLRRHTAADMPYADASFDVAFANHMLYLVPDARTAVAELRRVLRPGGRLYAATNGTSHVKELHDERERLVELLPQLDVERVDLRRFALDTGKTLLEAYFDEVRVFERRDVLLVTEVEPFVRYVLSLVNSPLDELLARDPDAAARIRAWRESVEDRFARGPVRVQRYSGFFEAF
jgi:SAM-dependent methyltransferase